MTTDAIVRVCIHCRPPGLQKVSAKFMLPNVTCYLCHKICRVRDTIAVLRSSLEVK